MDASVLKEAKSEKDLPVDAFVEKEVESEQDPLVDAPVLKEAESEQNEFVLKARRIQRQNLVQYRCRP
jgi:hypothetical protein